MADNTIITNTPAGWTAENVILQANQIGVEVDVRNGVNTVPAKAKMGDGVTPPRTLDPDIDIRHLVVPPMQGGFSYAAELVLDYRRFFAIFDWASE